MKLLEWDRSAGCVWLRVTGADGSLCYFAVGWAFGRRFVLQWLPRRWWASFGFVG